jgi:hypothetical protein
MSLSLAATDTITGIADTPDAVTYTITGDEIIYGADNFKVLAQGRLPSSVGTLYTVPTGGAAIAKSINLANTSGGAVVVTLAVKGTADANVILPPTSILAGGHVVLAGDGWRTYNDQGQLLSVGATGATGATGLNWLGAWSGATAYVVDDAVDDLGSSYICILGHTNQQPPNGTYWEVLAAAGGTITTKDEGGTLSAAVTTLDFVGDGVTASGAGAVTTVTVPGCSGIPESLIDAKGDLIVGSAADTAARLAVGATTGHVLTVDPGETLGVKWAAGGGGGGTPAMNAAALVTAYNLFR